MFDQELYNLEPREPYCKYCFLGYVFEWDGAEELKKGVRRFLEERKMDIYNTDIPGGQLWEKIIKAIRNTPFGLYDVSSYDAENVYAELGYAIAIDKPAYILVRKKEIEEVARNRKPKPRSDFSCHIQIRYKDLNDLYEQLSNKIPNDLTSPSWRLRIKLQSSTDAQKRALSIILNECKIGFSNLLIEMLDRGISWNNNDVSNLIHVFKEFLELEGIGDAQKLSIYHEYKEEFKRKLINQLVAEDQRTVKTCHRDTP